MEDRDILQSNVGRSAWMLAAFLFIAATAAAQPRADHHSHLISPAAAALSPTLKVTTASDLIAQLDAVGTEKAAILSVAYMYANPNRPPVADEYDHVRAENDWTSAQVAMFPKRLRGLCGLNPLKDYATMEIDRCAKDRFLRNGLKLHFGNSDIDMDNPEHVTRLRAVFRAANRHRMAIVVHMRASVTLRRPWGKEQAAVFLNQVLPEAPDVPVQIAHLAGAGSFDDATAAAVGVFADAISRHDPRVKRLYFDISGVAGIGPWRDKADVIVARMRQIGMDRLLYGSDLPPQDALTAFHLLSLTPKEFAAIERNVAPYLR